MLESIGFASAIVLGATLLASGVSKLRDQRGFVVGVLEYSVLPGRAAALYGYVVPFVEVAIGSSLLIGLWPRLAASLGIALITSFLFAVAINVWRGRKPRCHCFGSSGADTVGWGTIFRLGALLLCAVLVIAGRGDSLLARIPHDAVPDVLLAAGAMLLFYLLGATSLILRIWKIKADPGRSLTGGRTSLRSLPLNQPMSLAGSEPIERS